MGTHVREQESHVREFVMVERQALRRRMEAAVEVMIALLDDLDGDPDFEPDTDDEPTLGWREKRTDQNACPTLNDEAETGPWLEHPNQQHIGRLGRHYEDEEETALERHGTGFIASGPDDSEDCDPGGGDVCDERHDPEDCGGAIADPDALHLMRDELAFQRWMDDSRHARFKAHEATRTQILKVTGRKPGSHWGVTVRIQPW